MTLTRPARPRTWVPTPRAPAVERTAAFRRTRRLGPLTDGLRVVSLLCGWLLVQALVLGAVSESRAQDRLYDELRSRLAAATAPMGGVIVPGSAVALLRFPTLDRDVVVVEGTASGDLVDGPGHRRDTPLPGQQGVSLVYGRTLTYGAPFADVTRLRPGDEIVARTAQGRAVFTVDGVRRAGDPLPRPLPTGAARLTLVTAESGGPLGPLSARTAVYVDATMTRPGYVAPTGRLAAVPDSEHALGADTAALPLLVVGLAGVLVTVLGAVLARQRWAAAQVWLVAAPVLLAVTWSTTDVAMRLLPNLL